METKRIHIIIASIIFAVLAWVSVNMSYDYTVVKTIPIVVENRDKGKAFRYPLPRYITTHLRGNGWMLAWSYLSPELKYSINMSSPTLEDVVVTDRDLVENIKLPAALELLDVKPETLMLALTAYVGKRVPIIPHVVINFRDGYGQVGSIRVMPESVFVGGTKDEIDRLNGWHTEYRTFDDCYVSIDEEISLYESPTYSVEVPHRLARLQVPVQPLTEKVYLGIPVTTEHAPANREVIFIPPKVDITVRGGVDQLSKLTASNVEATVDYQLLVADSGGTVVPKFKVPADIKVIRRNPERLQFLIRKKL